jgi:hypothetical protein
VLTDAGGVPLVVRTTPANVNDETRLPALLDAMPAVQGPRGRPRRKPGSIFGDRAYGTAATIALVVMLGIFSFLAPRADDTHGSGLASSATWWSGRWPASASSAASGCATSKRACTSKPSTTWPHVAWSSRD